MSSPASVVVLSAQELEALLERAVTTALDKLKASEPAASEFVSVEEAAELLNCSVPTVRRRIKLGLLETTRVGVHGHVKVRRASIAKMLTLKKV